jgi:hypothetical protein
MVFQVPQFWDMASEGLQIFLYLTILFFFIKNRAIHKNYAVNKTKNGAEQSFDAQVFNIIVQKQVNQAFTNILETIAAERNCLKSVLGVNPLSSEGDDIFKVQPNFQLPNSHDKNPISDDRLGSAGRHDKVRKFSAEGLSVRKISEELKFPMSEVELILSLQK